MIPGKGDSNTDHSYRRTAPRTSGHSADYKCLDTRHQVVFLQTRQAHLCIQQKHQVVFLQASARVIASLSKRKLPHISCHIVPAHVNFGTRGKQCNLALQHSLTHINTASDTQPVAQVLLARRVRVWYGYARIVTFIKFIEIAYTDVNQALCSICTLPQTTTKSSCQNILTPGLEFVYFCSSVLERNQSTESDETYWRKVFTLPEKNQEQ